MLLIFSKNSTLWTYLIVNNFFDYVVTYLYSKLCIKNTGIFTGSPQKIYVLKALLKFIKSSFILLSVKQTSDIFLHACSTVV